MSAIKFRKMFSEVYDTDSLVGEVLLLKVKVGNDQEMTQPERNSHSRNRGWKNKLTTRYNVIQRKNITSRVGAIIFPKKVAT